MPVRKPAFALLLAGVMTLLTACSGGDIQGAQVQITPEAVSTPAPSVPAEIPEGRLLVSIHSETGEVYSADGQQAILYYDCQTPVVSGTNAQPINAVLRQLYEDFMTGAGGEGNPVSVRDYEELARRDSSWRMQEGMEVVPFGLSREVSVARGDESVVSFLFDEYYYTGGAHGTAVRKGISFRSDGSQLHFSDLSSDPEGLKRFCVEQMVAQSRSAEYAQYSFHYDYQLVLPNLVRDGNWYLSDEGLVIAANPYDIAPYAFGRIEFTVDYEQLASLVYDWLLPEPYEAEGTLWGALGTESDGEPVMVVDNGTNGQGQPIRFTADGPVHNVRLQRVQYNEHTGGFDPLGLLWYATSLQSGEMLRLLTYMPETMPNLKISYQGKNGREQVWYISQSGLDGALVLLDGADFITLPREISDELPFHYDLDNDGAMEVLDVRSHQSDEMGRTSLGVVITESDGSEHVANTTIFWDCSLWLADGDGDGRAEIFFGGDIGSVNPTLHGWYYDGTALKYMYIRDTRNVTNVMQGQIVSVNGGRQFTIVSARYVLGTYQATRPFAINDEGVFAPVEGSVWSFDNNDFWLELRCSLTAEAAGESITLPAGSHILLTGTDGQNWVEFLMEDYSTGRLALSSGQSGWRVDGVDEEEAFVVLPYSW